MTDEQTAADIMAMRFTYTADSMRAAIVRALQQARESALDKHANAAVLRMCHEARMMNGIVDYSDPNAVGVVRRVLGKLPITRDGCVFGTDAPTVYAWHHGEPMGAACVAESQQCDECGNEDMYEASECYSTREACMAANEMVDGEAAEAAKEAKK